MPDRKASSFNLMRPFAPNLLQREEFTVDATDDVTKFDEAFRRAMRNAARQSTAGKLRAEVGQPLDWSRINKDTTPLEQLFERKTRAKGAAREDHEVAADFARGIVNIPKNTVTAFGLKHGLVNVPALAMLSEGPGAALEAIARGAHLATQSPEKRYAALR